MVKHPRLHLRRVGTLFSYSGRCSVSADCKEEWKGKGRHGGELAGQRRWKKRRAISLTISSEEANKTLPWDGVTVRQFPCLLGTQFPYAGLGDP